MQLLPVLIANGKLGAFLGSKTSHGGTIVSGDSALMLDEGMAQMVGGLDEEVIDAYDETKQILRQNLGFFKEKI